MTDSTFEQESSGTKLNAQLSNWAYHIVCMRMYAAQGDDVTMHVFTSGHAHGHYARSCDRACALHVDWSLAHKIELHTRSPSNTFSSKETREAADGGH